MRILDKIRNIWNENFGRILALTLLNYTVFYVVYIYLGRYATYPIYIKIFRTIGFFYMMFMCFMAIFTAIYLINKKLSKILYDIFMVISTILFIIDFWLLYTFKAYISIAILEIILNTNKNETKEFFDSFFSIYPIIFIGIILISLYFISKIRFHIKSKKFIYFLTFITILQVGLIKNDVRAIKRTPIARLIIGMKSAKENMMALKDYDKKLNKEIKILENKNHIQDIVLILGESTSRNHMSIYGYEKSTSPNLKQLILDGDIVTFDDVISSQGTTIASLIKVLTYYNSESDKNWYSYNNISDIMKKASYNTFWFSNQEGSGATLNMLGSLANRANKVVYNVVRDSSNSDIIYGNFDNELVEKSKKYLNDSGNNFIIYHLMGAHNSYKNRYPKEYEKFTKKDYSQYFNRKLDDNQKEKVATYDNALLYDDFVVSNIMKIFENKDAIVIFISDHSEVMYENGDFRGHTNANISNYMIEIPFLVYTSPKFRKLHPKIYENIVKSSHNPYMTDDLINTILDIAGIKTPDYDPTRSVINPLFNKDRVRILPNGIYKNHQFIKN